MSQFYGAGGPWQTSWGVSGDASGAYMTSSAHGTGWSTSWDEMMGDSARMFQKHETSRPIGSQVNGFTSEPPVASVPAPTYDKPTSTYYEIMPGQSWDTVQQPSMPSKAHFASGNSSPQKVVSKPTPVATAPIWVEVTSADGWTVPSAGLTVGQAPTTPTKMRQKSTEIISTSVSPPQFQSASPNALAQNGKRHHDIEDELGHQDRYKTELCRSWHESGTCRYGSKCQFAHGTHELRPVMRHPKYKTEPCRSWMETRSCPYGRRCRFIHDIPSSNHVSNSINGSHHSNNGLNGSQIHPASNSHPMSHHLNGGVMQGMNSGVHGMNGAVSPVDGVGARHHSASSAVGHSAGYMPPIERSLSLDGHGQHNMMTHAHMNAQVARNSGNLSTASPAGLAQRQRLSSGDSNGYMSVHAYHTMSPHQQAYQGQYSQHNGVVGSSPSSAMSPANGSMNSGNAMYGLNSVLPGSPPYSPSGSNYGFGMSLFSGSPPLSTSASRENLAAARASNAPWLYDTFQDDDDPEDDDQFGNDALPLTPLIEQLNLHAEPVSPSLSHHHPHGAVAPIAPPSVAPGSTPGSQAPSAPAASAVPATEAAPTEKGKKKKGSRLHIFQRLSSK